MRGVIFFFSVLILSLALKSCNSVEPPGGLTINLQLEDVSCTEAWIALTTTNLQLPTTITLKQNNQTHKTINLIKSDTLLYIDSLLPNASYQYQASSIEHQVSSNVLNVTTMDTTSHNFTFETFTFGEHSSSVLFDVAIIDENNIWCVGEIYMNDSLGQPDPNAYNAVHLDGNEWNLQKITVEFRGNMITPPLEGVFAFSSTDIWFVGSLPIHGDGENWIMYDLRTTVDPNLSLSKAWGKSSDDIYFVGRTGSIAFYNGQNWQKIESGTDVDLLDVWGSPDGKIVWACGETIYKTVLIKIENNVAEIVFEGNYPMPPVKNRFSDGLLSLWTNSNNFIYVLTPYNLYRCFTDTKGEGLELYPYDDYFKGAYVRLRGTGINNLFTSGNKSTITHFNGISWKIYEELRNEDQYLAGLDANGNLIVTVGEKFENTFYYKAIVIVGRR